MPPATIRRPRRNAMIQFGDRPVPVIDDTPFRLHPVAVRCHQRGGPVGGAIAAGSSSCSYLHAAIRMSKLPRPWCCRRSRACAWRASPHEPRSDRLAAGVQARTRHETIRESVGGRLCGRASPRRDPEARQGPEIVPRPANPRASATTTLGAPHCPFHAVCPARWSRAGPSPEAGDELHVLLPDHRPAVALPRSCDFGVPTLPDIPGIDTAPAHVPRGRRRPRVGRAPPSRRRSRS